MFQYVRVSLHCTRCSMLSSFPHFRRHSHAGVPWFAVTRLRTKIARWSILRQLRSSVASDSGVPRVGQILSKGMLAPPKWVGQLISQLGRCISTLLCVKIFVNLLMVRSGRLCTACSLSGCCGEG